MTRAIAVLFFLSGFVALLYEVLWIRDFGYVLGASSPAIATVVAAYLSGLALGAWAAGRAGLGRRSGLAWYALLELIIAGTAPWVTAAMRSLDRALLDPSWEALQDAGMGGASRFGLAFVLLLVPTAMMGATLPVLCSALSGTVRRPGELVGRLYGLNTLGGVLGCLVAGFVVLEHVGLRASVLLAAGVNLALAAGAWILHRRARAAEAAEAAEPGRAPPPEEPPAEAPAAALPRTLVLVGILATSAVSIGAEMGWTRLLALAVGGTTYAFSLVLALFLAGLGLGSLLASWGLKRWPWSGGALGLGQLAVGTILLVGVGFYDEGVAWVGGRVYEAAGGFGGRAAHSLLAAAVLVLPPSIGFGLSFPLLTQMWVRGREALGRGVGLVYLVSTAGGVLGSTLTTFWFLPRFGLERSLIGFAVASVVLGVLFLAWVPRLRPLRHGLALAGLLMLGLFLSGGGPFADAEGDGLGARLGRLGALEPWNGQQIYGGVFLYGDQALQARRRLVSVKDGSACSVAVFEQNGEYSLAVNGKVDASGSKDMGTQLMLAWLPQLFHPDPREVFVLGWGSGVTAGAAAEYGSRVVCAEIEPAVVDAASYFEDLNFDARDRVEVRIDDGRSVLRRTDRRFDVITTEPSNPWMAGMSSLFTTEFYTLCRDRMDDDGVLCQWVQLYWSSEEDYRAILATLHSVFPHVLVFRSTFADSLMLASSRPFEADWAQLRARLVQHPAVGEGLALSLEEVGGDTDDALAYLGANVTAWGQGLADYVEGAPLITDDLPFLEFRAARRFQADSSATILAALEAVRPAEFLDEAALRGLLDEPRQSWLAAHRALFLQDIGRGLLRRGDARQALEYLDEAARRQPGLAEIELQRWGARLRIDPAQARGEPFEAVLRTCPHALDRVAAIALDAGEFGQALRANQLWQRQRGSRPEIFLQRGDILREAGRRGEARAAYEQAGKLGADSRAVEEAIATLGD